MDNVKAQQRKSLASSRANYEFSFVCPFSLTLAFSRQTGVHPCVAIGDDSNNSLWSTELLMFPPSSTFNWMEGHFYFEPGGQKVNTIRHYHLVFQDSRQARLSSKHTAWQLALSVSVSVTIAKPKARNETRKQV